MLANIIQMETPMTILRYLSIITLIIPFIAFAAEKSPSPSSSFVPAAQSSNPNPNWNAQQAETKLDDERKDRDDESPSSVPQPRKFIPKHEVLSYSNAELHIKSFDKLMKTAARGDNGKIRKLLEEEETASFHVLNLKPYTSNFDVPINAREFLLRLNKDYNWPAHDHIAENNRSMPLSMVLSDPKYSDAFLKHLGPLALAAMGGHIAAVHTLLAHLLNGEQTELAYSNRYEFIQHALEKVIRCSNMLSCNGMRSIFQSLEILTPPTQAQYFYIVRTLLARFNRIKHTVDANYLKKERADVAFLPSHEIAKDSVMLAMRYGSPDMLTIIAQAFSGAVAMPMYWHRPGLDGICRFHVQEFTNGEKLAILLSVNADPSSIVFQLSRGLLNNISHHPKLLERLKKYAQELDAYDYLGQQTLPDLAKIVAGYAEHCRHRMPPAIVQQILATHPADNIETDLNKLYLQVMRGQPAPQTESPEEGLLQHLQQAERQASSDNGSI